MAGISKNGSLHKAYIAGSKYSNVHFSSDFYF